MGLFRAKKEEGIKLGSKEEKQKATFEEFEKTEGVEVECVKITGKRHGRKLKFEQWSESEVKKLVELGYRWAGDEWVKDHPGKLYDEFKGAEKLLGGAVSLRIYCKREDAGIFQASRKVMDVAPTRIGFAFQQSELGKAILEEKKRREERGY